MGQLSLQLKTSLKIVFFGFFHISHAGGGYVLYPQIDLPSCRTDHDLIYGSMRFLVLNSQSDEVFYNRDYYHVSMESLTNDFNLVDWSPIYCSPSLDFQVSYFSVLRPWEGFFGIHVPLRRGRNRELIHGTTCIYNW
jgi:hypothetical protein